MTDLPRSRVVTVPYVLHRRATGMCAEVSWPIRRGVESLFVPTGAVAGTKLTVAKGQDRPRNLLVRGRL